jgi:hypothetical protein
MWTQQIPNITDSDWTEVPRVAGWAILPILIVGGNLLVMIVVLYDHKLRSTSLNKFIASRALADLLLGVVVVPVGVYVKVIRVKIFF